MNKRRMSILAKDKIAKLNGKINLRPGGRNLNTAMSMMHVSGNKKKKKRGHGNLSKSGDHHGIRKEVSGSSSPKKTKTKTKKVISPKAVSSVASPKSSGANAANQLRMVKSG